MRKNRRRVLALAAVCCVALAGCGKARGGMNVKTVKEPEELEETQLQGYTFGIPESWEEGDDSSEDTMFYYPDQAAIMVSYQDSDVDLSDDVQREQFAEGVGSGFEKFKLVDESEITVCDEAAYEFDMNARISGEDYSVQMISIPTGTGILCFMFGVLQDSDYDYSEQFDQIVESIEKQLVFNKTFDDMHSAYAILTDYGMNEFATDGVQIMDDGSTMELLIDVENDVIVTIIGDADENVEVISATSSSEAQFLSVCTMTLVGLDILSDDASDFEKNLSPENLKEMGTDLEDAVSEVIDGVSYVLTKETDGSYRLILQRDPDTAEDYEALVAEKELQ